MTLAIEVAEIALAVVTRQIDLAPVVLVETYCGLDRISHRCCHFHGCGALVQVWLAGHLEVDILCPQKRHLRHTVAELADLMCHCVKSTDIAAARGSGCTPEYLTEVQGLWPTNEIPPSTPLFPDARRSKKARTD